MYRCSFGFNINKADVYEIPVIQGTILNCLIHFFTNRIFEGLP